MAIRARSRCPCSRTEGRIVTPSRGPHESRRRVAGEPRRRPPRPSPRTCRRHLIRAALSRAKSVSVMRYDWSRTREAYEPTGSGSSLPVPAAARTAGSVEPGDSKTARRNASTAAACRSVGSPLALTGSDLLIGRLLSSAGCWLNLCLSDQGTRVGGSNRPATQRLIRGRALLIVSDAWLVVRKDDLGNKITPSAHSGFGKYVPEVPLHGVYAQPGLRPCRSERVTIQ